MSALILSYARSVSEISQWARLGILSLAMTSWTVPAALVGGLYYLLAGWGHLGRKERNSLEQTALVTDFLAGGLLVAFVVASLLR